MARAFSYLIAELDFLTVLENTMDNLSNFTTQQVLMFTTKTLSNIDSAEKIDIEICALLLAQELVRTYEKVEKVSDDLKDIGEKFQSLREACLVDSESEA